MVARNAKTIRSENHFHYGPSRSSCVMNLWESSSASSSEISLSPPSYSVQEDPSSGDLLSRAQQIWPDRPEFGRYSFEYEYLDQKRIKSKRGKRRRKQMQYLEPEAYQGRARAAGGDSRTNAFPASDVILPFHTGTAPTAISSDQTVRTSMLFSSTSGLDCNKSNQVTTTDDLLTLGGILPSAHSPDLVPSELLRSSCSLRQDRSMAGSCSSLPSLLDKEIISRMGSTYHFLGSATDQQALSALKVYPFVVFLKKGFSDKNWKVGFYVGGEARLFTVESLNIEEGGALWRITGTTYSIGFRTLEDMAQFYCRFPSTAE
ncbi:hypothetical protein GCK32_004203 [Trichostrongylus colubriformis]|uniref:Uncharacterized protein n=1 Tax=Trichostrongylus colubriformis TaxID=6319 RepID=A0AAN8IG75_TRICO